MNTDQPRRKGIAMSEQIKRYMTYFRSEDDGSVSYGVHESQYGKLVMFSDAHAALAAKDARIAELEAYICYADEVSTCAEQLLKMIQIDACGVTKDMVAVLRLDAALKELESFDNTCADGDATATPSEDGREVGHILLTAMRQYQHNDCSGLIAGYDMEETRIIIAELIAQHSRIVAAKDAEIARLRELHENAHSAAKTLMAERATLMEQAAHWLEVNAPSGGCIETNIADELRAEAEQLRAQPARQPVEDGPNYDKFYAGLYHKSSPMWKELHDLAVSKGYDHVRFAIECAPVYKCDCMGARKVAVDMDGNTRPCECVEAANEAQPARQMGGYSLSMSDYLRMANEAFGRVVDHDLLGNPITDYDVLLRGAYGPAVRRLVELAVSCAALAPAAVACVLPDRKDTVPPHGAEVALRDLSNERKGWNAALDEVTRLNRRAIPVELLKKQYDRIDYAAAMNDTHAVKALTNELRALLGKD